MKQADTTLWDVIVIGGGPAGMMAAGRAAERGAKVLLIEKNASLGKKLLITGGGRCNITNAEFDMRTLLSKFRESDKFLFSAFSQWSVQQTLDFFHARGMDTKIEAEKRVFPLSNKAQSVWDALVEYMKQGGVRVLTKTAVSGFIAEKNGISGVVLSNKKNLCAKSFILATGGKSHPETGSTGEGFGWLKKLGHTVSEPSAALVPLTIKDLWVKRVAGVALAQAGVSVLQNDVTQISREGKILFTHTGLSGPAILNVSRDVRELLKYGEVVIKLDLFPHTDSHALDLKVQEIFRQNNNKKFKNALAPLLASSLVPVIVELSKIDPDIQCNSIPRADRLRLITLLKGLPLQVKGLMGVKKAIVTSGGVSLKEVNFKTMQSRLFSNLYVIGDVLDIDRPSGGYSLQLCWTTGYVAGNSVEI